MLRDHEIIRPLVATLSEYVDEPPDGWKELESDVPRLVSLHLISDLGFPPEEFLPFMARFRGLLSDLYESHDFSNDHDFEELQEEFAGEIGDATLGRIISEVKHVACGGVYNV